MTKLMTAIGALMLPMWAKIALIILGAVCAIGGLLFLLGFINGFVQRATAGDMIRRFLALLLCVVIAVPSLFTGIKAQPAPKKTGTEQADNSMAETGDTSGGDIAADLEEFDAKAFYVDFDEEDLQLWLTMLLGEGFDLDGDVRANYSIDQFPSQADARNEAVKVAMRKYIDKDSEGFQDAVWYPFDEVLEAVYNGKYKAPKGGMSINWKKADNDKKDAFMDRYVRTKVYKQILASPCYADMWLQFIVEFDNEFDHIITERNSTWLPQFIKAMNDYYKRTEEPIGISAWFEMRYSKDEPIMLTEEYVLNAARLCNLLDCFDWAVPQVQALESKINWCLPMIVSANLSRTEKCPDQESLPAAILTHNYKSGNTAMKGGVNAFDGRAEIFDPKPVDNPKPIGNPDPVDNPDPIGDPDPDPDPDPKPDPVKHVLTIKYIYEDGSQAHAPYSGKYKTDAEYKVVSPKLKGYTPNRKVVKGVMPDHDHTEVVIYSKGVKITPLYTLTINYIYSHNGSKAAEPYIRTGLKKGDNYSRQSPSIAGYTPDKPKVKGVMPNDNVTITVKYFKDSDPEYTLTVKYQYSDKTQAHAPYSAKYKAGAGYSVPSPKITGYKPDRKVVKGTMPKGDHTEVVTYTAEEKITPQYVLTIYYKYKKDGSTAASTYTGKYYEGDGYNVTSPTIKGYAVDKPVVKGTMKASNLTVVVYYSKDGEGGKNPDDSNGNKNPDHPGGDNAPGDGTGEAQPTKPPVEDTPEQKPGESTSNHKPGQDNNAGSDNRQENSTEPIKATDPGESSGTGGKDHPVVDPNGGKTDNGTPPAKEEIPVQNDTNVTDTTTNPDGGTSSQTGNTSNEPVHQAPVAEPDMDD